MLSAVHRTGAIGAGGGREREHLVHRMHPGRLTRAPVGLERSPLQPTGVPPSVAAAAGTAVPSRLPGCFPLDGNKSQDRIYASLRLR